MTPTPNTPSHPPLRACLKIAWDLRHALSRRRSPTTSALLLGLALTLSQALALEPGRLYTRGPATGKQLALTFDDGPGPDTLKVADLLDRHRVHATFFLQGNLVSNRADVVRELARRGHELASHTSNHRNYLAHYRSLAAGTNPGSPAAQKAETRARNDLITDMRLAHSEIKHHAGIVTRLCRMPYGIDRPWVRDAAREAGYALVNWTYGADWEPKPAHELLPGYLNAIQPGAILLFHDGGRNRTKTITLVDAVIQDAKSKGYQFVTVSQLLTSTASPHAVAP
jgi:peptidoglycan-N-acetylglucosamine deacetylase